MAEDDETTAAIGRIPAMIKASRDDFARLYDAEALAQEGDDVTSLRVLVQEERLLNPAADVSNDAVVFALAFRQATEANWVRALVRRVVKARMLTMPGNGNSGDTRPPDPVEIKAMDRIGALSAPEDEGIQIELQANVNPADGYLDPLSLAAEMNLVTRRVCQVLIDRRRLGTGFLVGPQVVLTNWHVVKALYEPDKDGPMTTIKDRRLKVVFDNFRAPAAGNAVLSSDGGVTYFATSIDASNAAYQQEYSDEAIDIAKDLWKGELERLDFALLRLEGLPGIDRGFYRLAKDLWPVKGNSIYLAQYPGQHALRVTSGLCDVLCDDTVRRRVRHLAKSAPGSSGGLCLSFDSETSTLKPSALHQAGVKLVGAGGQSEVKNQAVPLAKIAPLIENLARQADAAISILRLNAASGPDQVGAPVFGRAIFQKHVAEAVSGEARILVVRPAVPPGQSTRGIGKSFSAVLLRSLLPPDGHVIAAFTASMIPSDASACAQTILQQVAAAKPGQVWSGSDTAATTETAWINNTLIDQEFAPRLNAAARGRMVWLVIDDLDRDDLPDAGGRRFLDALYQRVETMPALRIVLIGLMRDLTSYSALHVRIDSLPGPPGEGDLVTWLTRRFGPERAIDPDLLQSFAKLTAVAADAPGAAALAKAVKEKLDGNLPPEWRSQEAFPP